MSDTEHIPCQIYLITPPQITDLKDFLKQLESALSAAPIACLQIRLKNLENSALIQAAQSIVPICHRYGERYYQRRSIPCFRVRG